MTCIAVTGANGFVGKELQTALRINDYDTKLFTRTRVDNDSSYIVIDDIGPDTQWHSLLLDVDTVTHLAARVHVMQDNVSDPLHTYREVNTFGTETLAKAAVKAGVKRFIYVSTIKVNGDTTNLVSENTKKGFSESDLPNPTDPYAVSKWEAEQLLTDLGKKTGLEVVIIRPPLVYGPNVKANFLRLLNFAEKGTLLPLGGVRNLRSLVSVYNFVDFIIRCIEHPAAKGETFLVSDGCDISTPDLMVEISKAMHKKSRVFPFPVTLLKLLGRVTGKSSEINRLCSSLQVDISKANAMLGWHPPVSLEEGIRRTVEWYLDQR